jgi:predicted permease
MTWWKRLWRHKQLEQQLDQELRFHLDQHAATLIAQGLPPDQAAREARLALGGPQQVKEECRDARGTRWLEDFAQDVRYALRTLRQHPSFAAVTLCTLALGIGATTVMFTVIDGVLLKPLAYPDPERLVALHGQMEKYGDRTGISYPNFLDCQRQSHSLAPLAAWTYSGGTLSEPGESQYVEARQISSRLFSVFGLPLARGRAFTPEEDRRGAPPVAIISDALWRSRYAASPSAIGARLIFDGKAYTVVGVAPAGFQLDGEAGVFTPLGQVTEIRLLNRAANFIRVVGRLRNGVTLAQSDAELAIIGRQLANQYPQTNAGLGFLAFPLRQELVSDVRSSLWLLLGAVGMLLLIACANVASLLLARAVSRERELAMRVALGAGRGRLIRQCLTESAVLGLAGGVLGVALAAFGIRPFAALWPGSLPRATEIGLDWRVLLFALAASLTSGLIFGIAPALRAPARELEQTLRSGARTVTASARRMHSVFVITQIALAVVLLIAAGILGRAVLRLSSLDPGLDIHNVLTAHVALSPAALQNAAQIRAAWQQVLDNSRSLPGVQSTALADIIPMREGFNGLGYWTTPTPPPPNQMPVAVATCITPGYFKVMGIPLRQGRIFNDHDRIGTELVVVVDEVLAQHVFPHESAVGKRFWVQAMGPGPMRVAGVVGHVRHWGLADDDQSQLRDQIYYPFAQVGDPLLRLFSTFMSIAIRTSVPPLGIVEPLRRQLRSPTGDQAIYEVRSMEQLASASLARQRFLLVLFGIFAGLALLLACIGIYGVLAYVTSQRVPEIGLRIALGASARDVVRMVLRQSLQMIFAGVAIGVVSAFAGGRLLERLVAGVRAAEPATFALMISLLIASALIASFIPARRASRIHPMQSLRKE